MAGIAGGAEVIATPECEIEPQEVADRVRAAYTRGKTHALVVVAEGAKHGAEALMGYFAAHRDSIGFGLRVTTLGHVVRGGVPTAFDRVLATRLGAAAIDELARGAAGMLLGMLKNEIAATPLSEVAGRTKPITCDLLELARMLAQ
jgi:6-phosphofructokinase 1